MRRFKIIIITVNILLLPLQLVLSSSRASDSQDVSAIESRIQSLKAQNQDLADRIYRLSSSQMVFDSAKAADLVILPIVTLTPPSVASIGRAP